MTYAGLRRSERLQAKSKLQMKSRGKTVKFQLHPNPMKIIDVGDGIKSVTLDSGNAAKEAPGCNIAKSGDSNRSSTMHADTNQPTLVSKKPLLVTLLMLVIPPALVRCMVIQIN